MTDFDFKSAFGISEALGVAALQETLEYLDLCTRKDRICLLRALASHFQQDADMLLKDLSYLSSNTIYVQGSPEAQLAEYAINFRALVTQEHSLVTKLHEQQALTDIASQTQEFSSNLQQGSLSEAAWSVVRLRKLLQDAQDCSSNRLHQEHSFSLSQTHVFPAVSSPEQQEHLRLSYQACDSQLALALETARQEALTVETLSMGGTITVRSVLSSGVLAEDAWAAMKVVGTLHSHLGALSTCLMDSLLAPAMRGCMLLSVQDPHNGLSALVRWAEVPQGEGTNPEEACKMVLKLLGLHLFHFDAGLVTELGNVLWPRLSAAYLAAAVVPFMAEHTDDVDACGAKVQAATDLESFAESLGFIDGDTSLSQSAEAQARQAMQMVVVRYLFEARDLLVEPATEVLSGSQRVPSYDSRHLMAAHFATLPSWEVEDPPCGIETEKAEPLACSQYKITKRAAGLVELMSAALCEACGAESRARACALRSTVSALATALRTLPRVTMAAGIRGGGAAAGSRALQPPEASSVLSTELHAVPMLVLLYFNDLCYVSRWLLLASAVFGSQARALQGETLSFVEEAEQLRAFADEVWAEHVRSQCAALDQLTEAAGSWASLAASKKRAPAFKRMVAQVLHTLGRVGSLCAELLRAEERAALGAALLSHVAECWVRDITHTSDIGADESTVMAQVLQQFLAEGVQHFVRGGAGSDHGRRDAGAELHDSGKSSRLPEWQIATAVRASARSLSRLSAVVMLLDAKLVEVVDAWVRGQLAGQGLSAAEVSQLVCALFQDSDTRRSALATIASS